MHPSFKADISPVLSKRALISYLSKYISKSEPFSQSLIDLVNLILERDDNLSIRSIVQRLFIHSVSERDYGAQEVCLLLIGLKLNSTGGRKVVNLYTNHADWINIDAQKRGKSTLEKYQDSDIQYEDWWLMKCCKERDIKSNSWSKNSKEAIVQIFPKEYLKTYVLNDEENDGSYRQQCLLYLTWRT
ncbi:hypothetical protein KUF71_002730 [Frankliniella fusca]|uniref:Uncharacterized protein n=1 Tax=Frankliniella fusca TaxID=407009 RepID=A0AAE1I3P1_9NEOP|nr:hypothetical protein KUF71_002730 [Frankliniella fusca]